VSRDTRPIVVYVAGAGRSGSTLLETLLAERTSATAVGEIRSFLGPGYRWGAKCQCGRAFLDCPFWSEVMGIALPDASALNRERLEKTRRALITNRSLAQILRGRDRWNPDEKHFAELYDDVYRAVVEVAESPLILDSSKSVPFALFLDALGSIDLRVVHLVRDSRAVTYSWQREKPWLASPEEEKPLMETRRPLRVAREWVSYNALADLLRTRVQYATLVRYEDLATAPDVTIERIVQTLALPSVANTPAARGHGFLGNPIRFATLARDVRRDDEWRSVLSAKDHRIATALTLPQLLRYGYRP